MRKLLLLLTIFFFSFTQAQINVDGFVLGLFDDSIDKPIDIAMHPDNDKMVVVERNGIFWLYNLVGEDWIKEDTPFLDISNQVTTYFERGVESILVDKHFVYVYYTVEESYLFPDLPIEDDSATVNRVSRWEVAWRQNITVFGEHILVDGIPSLAGNHQGGGLSFGKDGYGWLFISTGDGSNAGYSAEAVERGIIPEEHKSFEGRYRSQIKSSPNGKILRVVLWNGDGMVGNPYYDINNKSSWQSRIYDYGYRNPFRIFYDKAQDSLFVADVGAGTKEEITIAKPDGNAGWGKYEGFNENSFSTSIVNPDTNQPFEVDYQNKPILDYGHNGNPLTRLLGEDGQPFIDTANPIQGNSITGGVVLKEGFGQFTGFYMFTDYSNGAINLLSPDRTYTINFASPGTIFTPISIKQGVDGSVYVISLFGDIQRIYFEGSLSVDDKEFFNRAKLVGYYDMLGRKLKEPKSTGIYIALYELDGVRRTKKLIKLEN